jgi:hypothetical protein
MSITTLLEALLSVDEPPGPAGSLTHDIVGMEQLSAGNIRERQQKCREPTRERRCNETNL